MAQSTFNVQDDLDHLYMEDEVFGEVPERPAQEEQMSFDEIDPSFSEAAPEQASYNEIHLDDETLLNMALMRSRRNDAFKEQLEERLELNALDMSFSGNETRMSRRQEAKTSNKVKQAFQTMGERAKGVRDASVGLGLVGVSLAADGVKDAAGYVKDKAVTAKDAVVETKDKVADYASGKVQSFKEGLQSRQENVKESVTSKFSGWKRAMASKVASVKDRVKDAHQRVVDGVDQGINNVHTGLGKMRDKAAQTKDQVVGLKDAAVSRVHDAKESTIDKFHTMKDSAKTKAVDAGKVALGLGVAAGIKAKAFHDQNIAYAKDHVSYAKEVASERLTELKGKTIDPLKAKSTDLARKGAMATLGVDEATLDDVISRVKEGRAANGYKRPERTAVASEAAKGATPAPSRPEQAGVTHVSPPKREPKEYGTLTTEGPPPEGVRQKPSNRLSGVAQVTPFNDVPASSLFHQRLDVNPYLRPERSQGFDQMLENKYGSDTVNTLPTKNLNAGFYLGNREVNQTTGMMLTPSNALDAVTVQAVKQKDGSSTNVPLYDERQAKAFDVKFYDIQNGDPGAKTSNFLTRDGVSSEALQATGRGALYQLANKYEGKQEILGYPDPVFKHAPAKGFAGQAFDIDSAWADHFDEATSTYKNVPVEKVAAFYDQAYEQQTAHESSLTDDVNHELDEFIDGPEDDGMDR